MSARTLCALAFVVVLAACNADASQGAAESSADSATSGVYNNDLAAVTSNFDDALKSQVSRAEVGTLSDMMHAHGAYKKLSFLSEDAAKNEYTYRADFDRGSMNVVIRLDTDGRLAAYRVFANT